MSSTSLVKDDLVAWQEGVRQFEGGDMDVAYQHFCEITDQNSCIVFNLATVHLILGNFQEAYGLYTEASEKDPYLVAGFYQRACASHWMNKHEDALEDLNKALELMRESHAIDYSPLGMDLVLCSFQIHWCLAVVKICLNLHEGARRSHAKAIETKEKLADDALQKDSVKDVLKSQIPELTSMLADPCMSGHRFGACPLPLFDPPPIFKPRGVAKKVLEMINEKSDSTGKDGVAEEKAKVLWFSDSTYNFVGFQGAKHKHELMPMFIRTGKKKKKSVKGLKEPPTAIGGLIKAASPQLINVKPNSSSSDRRSATLPRSSSPSFAKSQPPRRRATLSAADLPSRARPLSPTEPTLRSGRSVSLSATPTILVEDFIDTKAPELNAKAVVSAIPEQNEEEPDHSSSSSAENEHLHAFKDQLAAPSKVRRRRSVEVLCTESSAPDRLHETVTEAFGHSSGTSNFKRLTGFKNALPEPVSSTAHRRRSVEVLCREPPDSKDRSHETVTDGLRPSSSNSNGKHLTDCETHLNKPVHCRLSRRRSGEVVCRESPVSSHWSREPSPDGWSNGSSPQPNLNSLLTSPQPPVREIDTHAEMTPENLRALADLLEKLQASNGHGKVAVHVHFHGGPGNVNPPASYQAA